MKRSITYILSLLMAVAASATDYRLWIDNFEIKPGETKTVNLNMDNATEVTGLQTDLVLPEGLEILQDEDGYFIELNTTRATRNHSWGCNATPDGVIHIISYTQDVRPFNLSSGPVMSITFKASKTFSGENALEIKNSELVNANGQSFFPANETCNINKLPDFELGDVNGDGVVDITDVNIIINIMLGKEDAGKYNGRADMTGDGDVDVSDVNAAINKLLGK